MRKDDRGERGISEEPIEAAELAGRVRQTGLSLTAEIPEAVIRIAGRLSQVTDIGEAGLMLMVQEVRGMAAHDICSAVIDRPAPAVDECLARIGRGGRIALKGQATASPETIARVHIHRVDMINGRSLAAIAAEDGPARPLAAAELHRRANGGLERYVRIAASGRIDGHLKDVHRGGAPGEAYAIINHVDGLDSRQFCIAVVPQVDKQTEELLEKIGRGGRIRLTGSCTAEAGGLAAVRMDRVRSTSDSAHELTPQRSPAQMCTPSMSTLTALTDPQERPSGSVPQSRMVSYGFGPSLIGSTAACSGGPEAPRWAAAAAGSRSSTAPASAACCRRRTNSLVLVIHSREGSACRTELSGASLQCPWRRGIRCCPTSRTGSSCPRRRRRGW